MTFDYNKILRDNLAALQKELGLDSFNIEVDSEQSFIKTNDMKSDTIFVLTKELQNDRSIGVETQPLQIFILSEQDSLDSCRILFQEFAKRNNFVAFTSGNDWIKQQYTDPVVLSNFNTVDFGYRSVLYVSATLYIMKNVIDVSNVMIDGVSVLPLSFGMSYSMSANSQQLTTEFISSSVKSVSSFALTISIALLLNAPVKKILNIINETDDTNNTDLEVSERIAYDGNNPFVISFDLKVADNSYSLHMEKTVRLINGQLITAPNQVPSLQLGFVK